MMRQQQVRGDRAVKVHLAMGAPHLRTTGTACYGYSAADVLTTVNLKQVTCATCLKRAAYRR